MLITIGEEEMNAKSIKIKDMSSGKEDIIKNKNIEKDIKNISNNEK
jgi:histidyl-tRNA synthetase